jgi:hypothetical protein
MIGTRRILESSSDEDNDDTPLIHQNQNLTENGSNSEPVTQFAHDSSEEEQEFDTNEIESSNRKPTKKDRQEAFISAQRALRELQFDLPRRKSKFNMNTFLKDRGIDR